MVAGDESLTGKVWSKDVTGNDANVMKQDGSNSNKYSITYTNVPAGSHDYQILPDPDNKGWELVWWGSKTNHTLTLTSVSDVTLTIDLTDSNHDVDVKIVPKEALTINNADTFFIEKGTATALPIHRQSIPTMELMRM